MSYESSLDKAAWFLRGVEILSAHCDYNEDGVFTPRREVVSSDEAGIELQSASHVPSPRDELEINFAVISQFHCEEAQDRASP